MALVDLEDVSIRNSNAMTIAGATQMQKNVTDGKTVQMDPMKILIIAVRYNDTNFHILDIIHRLRFSLITVLFIFRQGVSNF